MKSFLWENTKHEPKLTGRQESKAACQKSRKVAAQRQNSVQGEASLHALAGSFTSLTVCLPSHDAAWHPSGSVPYNILRCWGRCCLYQSAGQPWADCSASPSLTPVAPAGSAAEKYHPRKGVNHTHAETRALSQTLDSIGYKNNALCLPSDLWRSAYLQVLPERENKKKPQVTVELGWQDKTGQHCRLHSGYLSPFLLDCRWPLSKPQQWSECSWSVL